MRVSWHVNSIDLLEQINDLIKWKTIVNWDDSDSSLLEELDVGSWDVALSSSSIGIVFI